MTDKSVGGSAGLNPPFTNPKSIIAAHHYAVILIRSDEIFSESSATHDDNNKQKQPLMCLPHSIFDKKFQDGVDLPTEEKDS